MDEPIRRPNTFPFCGRLIALPTSRALQLDERLDLLDSVSIDFPAMPDAIELVRRTDYMVQTAPNLPDGIHLYKGTQPMEIPFTFRLHSFDEEYCPKGALTLLQLAARLHSFVLPISSNDNAKITTKVGEATDPSNATSAQEDRAALPNNPVTVDVQDAQIYAPVTVVLELMQTEVKQPGISCVGYVKDVSVKLNGPWLRGPGKSYNLPSSADFAFTFIHRPGHGNTFRISQEATAAGVGNTQPQAFATWVKDNLYNTRELVKFGDYRGFSAAPTLAETREQAPQPETEPAQQQFLSLPQTEVNVFRQSLQDTEERLRGGQIGNPVDTSLIQNNVPRINILPPG